MCVCVSYNIYIYIYTYIKWVSPRRDLYLLGFIYSFCSYIHVCFQLVAFVREHIWHKALLMGYLKRLELNRVCSLNGFQLVMGLYRGHPLFFRVCLLWSALPLIDIWYIFVVLYASVWVLEWFWISLKVIFPLSIFECVLENFWCVYTWLCGLKFTRNYFLPIIFVHIFICLYPFEYIYICFQLDAFVREHVWHKV